MTSTDLPIAGIPMATMLADLDLLLTAVFCIADDLLPERGKNARPSVTDPEVVTLAVAQEMMGINQIPAAPAIRT